MAKQRMHSSGRILKPLPKELLQNGNPAASPSPVGSQACQNSSGAYPSARRWKYFQLLSTETKLLNHKEVVQLYLLSPQSLGFLTFFNPLPSLPFLWDSSQRGKSCQPFSLVNSCFGLSLLHLKWMELSMDQYQHHHRRINVITHSFPPHLGIGHAKRISLEFLPLELALSSLGG